MQSHFQRIFKLVQSRTKHCVCAQSVRQWNIVKQVYDMLLLIMLNKKTSEVFFLHKHVSKAIPQTVRRHVRSRSWATWTGRVSEASKCQQREQHSKKEIIETGSRRWHRVLRGIPHSAGCFVERDLKPCAKLCSCCVPVASWKQGIGGTVLIIYVCTKKK